MIQPPASIKSLMQVAHVHNTPTSFSCLGLDPKASKVFTNHPVSCGSHQTERQLLISSLGTCSRGRKSSLFGITALLLGKAKSSPWKKVLSMDPENPIVQIHHSMSITGSGEIPVCHKDQSTKPTPGFEEMSSSKHNILLNLVTPHKMRFVLIPHNEQRSESQNAIMPPGAVSDDAMASMWCPTQQLMQGDWVGSRFIERRHGG